MAVGELVERQPLREPMEGTARSRICLTDRTALVM